MYWPRLSHVLKAVTVSLCLLPLVWMAADEPVQKRVFDFTGEHRILRASEVLPKEIS